MTDMSMIEMVKAKARAEVKRIVLPEGDEPRTVAAAEEITREGLAEPVLLGDPEKIREEAKRQETDLSVRKKHFGL